MHLHHYCRSLPLVEMHCQRRSSLKIYQKELLFVLESPDLQLSQQRATGLAEARGQELLGLSGLQDGEERRKGGKNNEREGSEMGLHRRLARVRDDTVAVPP